MKVYIDTSALNRIFDDQTQARIFLESSSMLLIFVMTENRTIDIVSSEALVFENSRNPFEERRLFVEAVLKKAGTFSSLDRTMLRRAQEMETNGIRGLDALHLAAAENATVDTFITCDDRIAKRYNGNVRVQSPIEFAASLVREAKNHDT